MRVDDDEIIPLLDSQESVARYGQSLFALIVGFSQRSANRLLISMIRLCKPLANLLETLPLPIFFLCDTSQFSNFRGNLKRYRYLFTDPAGYSACWIRDSSDEDLVSSDTLHHPGGPTNDELRPRLAILGDEGLVKNTDRGFTFLLDDEVLFLVRNH